MFVVVRLLDGTGEFAWLPEHSVIWHHVRS